MTFGNPFAALYLSRLPVTEPRAPKKCHCGHTRDHPEIQQDPEYTLWGWIQLSMIGITPLPERIVFRCIRCKKSVGVTRDPDLLRKKMKIDAP